MTDPISRPNPQSMRNKVSQLMAGPTVTMMFPQKVSLILDSGDGIIDFHAGVQEVPESLADHWWLADNGARRYARPAVESASDLNKAPGAAMSPVLTDHHVKYLNSLGYKNVSTIADAQGFFDKLTNEAKSSFLLQAEKWQEPKSEDLPPANGPDPLAEQQKAPVPETQIDLKVLTKAELAAHAADVHDAELDPAKMNKDEMIAEIERLRSEKG